MVAVVHTVCLGEDSISLPLISQTTFGLGSPVIVASSTHRLPSSISISFDKLLIVGANSLLLSSESTKYQNLRFDL